MAHYWFFNRYKQGSFKPGQKGTCRTCNGSIYFIFDPEPNPMARNTRGAWAHDGVTLETYNEQEHYAAPKEFCNEVVSTHDYDYCGTPVKFEDQRAENYCCGRHMRKYLEEKAYQQRRIEEQAKRERQEAMEAFEAEQYDAAAAWIRDHGFSSLIGEHYQAKPKYSRLKRHTEVDVCKLKEFLENVVERLVIVEAEVDIMGLEDPDEATG